MVLCCDLFSLLFCLVFDVRDEHRGVDCAEPRPPSRLRPTVRCLPWLVGRNGLIVVVSGIL